MRFKLSCSSYYDVIYLWRHFDAVIMTSYFCDVILTPSLWRHILVTSLWRRHYDVIFFDVILTPSLWRHFFLTSFPHRSSYNDDEPCKSTENDTRQRNASCAHEFAPSIFHVLFLLVAGNQLLLLLVAFYVGLHFVVWKWRENQFRIMAVHHERHTASALEPLNSTSEWGQRVHAQVKKVTQKSINKITYVYWL
jgi:hypothetical protein